MTDGTRPDVLRKLELALQESIQDPVVIELDDAQLQPGFVGTIETKAKISADVEKIIRIIGEVKLDTPALTGSFEANVECAARPRAADTSRGRLGPCAASSA